MNFSTDPIRMETWSIDRLIPYARNPRKNDRAVDRMCGSIREIRKSKPRPKSMIDPKYADVVGR